jgi:hypothetical protein
MRYSQQPGNRSSVLKVIAEGLAEKNPSFGRRPSERMSDFSGQLLLKGKEILMPSTKKIEPQVTPTTTSGSVPADQTVVQTLPKDLDNTTQATETKTNTGDGGKPAETPPVLTPEQAKQLKRKQRKEALRKRAEEAKKRKEERKKEGLGERRDVDYDTIEICDQVIQKEKSAGMERSFRVVVADLVQAGKAVADLRMRTLTDCGHLVTVDIALVDAVAAIAFLEAKRNECFARTKMMLPFTALIPHVFDGTKWEAALNNPAVFLTKEEK